MMAIPSEDGVNVKMRISFYYFWKGRRESFNSCEKDGAREEFAREKVRRGLIRACEKRPVSAEQIEEIVNEVERELRNIGDSEIASDLIGEKVMNKLANLDEVAYVRFASVYRQFKDISVFVEELKDLMEKIKIGE